MPKNTFFRKKMCVLNTNFGNQVTSINLYYRNLMRYSILGEIIPAKLTLKLIIWSKRPKTAKKHIFSLKMCVLCPNLSNKVTLNNFFKRNSMRRIILDEINRVKLVLERIIWSKWPKIAIFAKKHIFSLKKVCSLSRISNCEHKSS